MDEELQIRVFKDTTSAAMEVIRLEVDKVRNATGNDVNKAGLCNVGIVYNNKVMELINMFHKHDVGFFANNQVGLIVLNTLSSRFQVARECLEKYIKNNMLVTRDGKDFIINPKKPDLGYYNAQTDFIFRYDIKKELPDTIARYYQSCVRYPEYRNKFMHDYRKIREAIARNLEELNLEDISDECLAELDYCYEALLELRILQITDYQKKLIAEREAEERIINQR